MKTIKKYREARGIKQVDLAAQFGRRAADCRQVGERGRLPAERVMPELAALPRLHHR